jgi:hypothetical protein
VSTLTESCPFPGILPSYQRWAQIGVVNPPTQAANRAQAGIPGTWLPAGSVPPATVAALQTSGITAQPATAWTTGQFVQTQTAGAPGRATWTGTGWVGGVAP